MIAAPTAPRLKSLEKETLSVEKWIDSLSDASSGSNHSGSSKGYHRTSAWIPEGSLYPPGDYASAVAAARSRSYQRMYSDYSSTSASGTGSTVYPKQQFQAEKYSKRVSTTNHRYTVHSQTPSTHGKDPVDNPFFGTRPTPGVVQPQRRGKLSVSSLRDLSLRSSAPLDSPYGYRNYRGHTPSFYSRPKPIDCRAHERRRSIATHEMINSLRSQCATLATHRPEWKAYSRHTSSRGASFAQVSAAPRSLPPSTRRRGRKWMEADLNWAGSDSESIPSLESDFGSRLSLVYPRTIISPPSHRMYQSRARLGHSRSKSTISISRGGSCSESSEELVWSLGGRAGSLARGSTVVAKEPALRRPQMWNTNHRRFHSQSLPPSALAKVTRKSDRRRSHGALKMVRFAPLPTSKKINHEVTPSTSSSSTWSSSSTGLSAPASDKEANVVPSSLNSTQRLRPVDGSVPSTPVSSKCGETTPNPLGPQQHQVKMEPDKPSPLDVFPYPKDHSLDDPDSSKTSNNQPLSRSPSSHFFSRTFSRRSLSRIIRSETGTRGDVEMNRVSSTFKSRIVDENAGRRDTPATRAQQKSRIPLPLRTILRLK
ncbi:hypothetical protein CC1G_00899 [Coprinopsis cinerea okayama7|uniref:Uncharacterized protein n=1 Tax=Coprinopsis cinerea (strain Okayama-7 / 130 / ATCC MYA-4618 / FGSC 9003) TaxID=240176 RepID=A8N924_COPC7|nr:hypothetical protein CC1G_00899 [Coprinopsis cinerea okayama7\|eukprot:XP_001831352.2 hypothetical protein CC1G_00899 [Coprinopsis cinerea okayama7\